MDSAGNEVIIVDDRAQTNGFNGNYSEELIAAAAAAAAASSEMKTRSKASGGPGEAAKLRSRAAANVANSHGDKTAPAAVATASPATVISGSNVSTSAAAEKDKKMSLRSGVADQTTESSAGGKAGSAAEAKKSGGSGAGESTPGPKSSKKGSGSVGDREDDSGINSRASSVSTDDTYSSRLRTRSKRAEALSSSTPASTKRTTSRMPLSTYDYDDDSIILHIDEDPSSSRSALKRRATKFIVEEMEEEDAAAGTAAGSEDDDEPLPKIKVTLKSPPWYLHILQPFKSLKRGFPFSGPLDGQNEKPATDTDPAATQTNPSAVKDNEPVTVRSSEAAEAPATTATNEEEKEASNTCMVM